MCSHLRSCVVAKDILFGIGSCLPPFLFFLVLSQLRTKQSTFLSLFFFLGDFFHCYSFENIIIIIRA